MIKKIIISILILVAAFVAYIGVSYGPAIKKYLTMERFVLAPDLVAFIGYGGNSIVFISADKSEALIVDTKMLGGAKALHRYIQKMAPNAKVTIVNTHFHPDHTRGNKRFPGATVISSAYTREQWQSRTGMQRLPDVRVQTGEAYTFTIGVDTIIVRNLGRGHTWNDAVVWLKNRKLLLTGDLVFNTWHPALLPEDGCDVDGWIACLDSMLQDFDAETVIPGHGPMGGREVLLNQRDYFVSIRHAVGDERQIQRLEEKYKDYFEIPGTSSVRKTAEMFKRATL